MHRATGCNLLRAALCSDPVNGSVPGATRMTGLQANKLISVGY
jgi:hypothetical protein